MTSEEEQRAVCARFATAFMPTSDRDKLGIALATLAQTPLNGLRLPPEQGTCGWYIWGGTELSSESDFFQPLHVHHLEDRCPKVLPYLALPPGHRFLIAPDHEDVWEDDSLLKT